MVLGIANVWGDSLWRKGGSTDTVKVGSTDTVKAGSTDTVTVGKYDDGFRLFMWYHRCYGISYVGYETKRRTITIRKCISLAYMFAVMSFFLYKNVPCLLSPDQ